MSSKPSAFDALMSGARAAAAKKKPPQPPSPNKRKTPDSATSQNPNPVLSPSNAPESSAPETERQKLNSSPDAKKLKQVQDNGGIKKSPISVSASERVAQLKSKIPLLKNKAAEFDPKKVASWGEGERVPFIFLCLAFDLISHETGRIVITDIVCNALRTVMNTTPDDLLAAVYLLANRIAPAHEGLELGIGDASIIKALAEACGRKEVQIKKQYKVKILVLCSLIN